MFTAMTCKFPCWPMGPIFGIPILAELLVIAAVVFSLVMLIDCLRRPASKFYHPLTKNGEYDKLIWAAGILLSLSFYCVGAIAYFFVVRKAKPESSE